VKLPAVLPALLLASLPLSAAPISPLTMSAVYAIGDSVGVPRSVTRALMLEESGGDPLAVSRFVNGYRSRGLYQLYEEPRNLSDLIARYWDVGEFNIADPIHNATVALRYLAALHRAHGTWELALVFYNHGSLEDVPRSTLLYARRIIRAR